MELRDTVELMNSKDYVDRFKAEYLQLDIRIQKLEKTLNNWNNLNFQPKCPKQVLNGKFLDKKALDKKVLGKKVLDKQVLDKQVLDEGSKEEEKMCNNFLHFMKTGETGVVITYKNFFMFGPCHIVFGAEAGKYLLTVVNNGKSILRILK